MFDFAAAEIEAQAGIRTHLGKLKVWGPRAQPAPPELAALGPAVWVSDAAPADSGIVMLGSPIGRPEFAHAWCAVRAAVTHRLTARFPLLSSAQCRWLLLRYSAEPRVNHALRTLPPLLSLPLAVDHDVTLWQSLLALLDFAPAP